MLFHQHDGVDFISDESLVCNRFDSCRRNRKFIANVCFMFGSHVGNGEQT